MASLQTQLTVAQNKVAEYMAAETAALEANRVRMTGPDSLDREVEMSSLKQIRDGLTYWSNRCTSLEAQIAGAPTFGGRTFSVASFDK
jgi:hypothetical protein